MRFLLSFLIIIACWNSFAQQQIQKSSSPKWINRINFTDKDILEGSGGEQYLLIDIQTNISQQTSYFHYAVKLINSDGVQDNSDISVNFDPSYQNIKFHKINIIRDGKRIDQLNIDKFQIFQRENNMERSLYDGSLTAVLNLSDIRGNDVIEYSYSRNGFNPINNGNYSNIFYQQYAIPINRIYNRLLIDKNQKINYKSYENAKDPVVKQTDYGKEYVWDLTAMDNRPYETNVPAWFDPYRRVGISTYESWSEIVNQSLPLYAYSEKEIESIYKLIQRNLKKEPNITDLIRFVQNDIRYLGFEAGISAYKPNSPQKVYKQRYGDCKDKSLLLSSLLRKIGIEAYPFLVNTEIKKELSNLLPASNGFNHCIVNFNIDGKNYFVDPTISCQGGDLDHFHAPDYKFGLRIKKGEQSLTQMPVPKADTIVVTENITLDSIRGNAKFVVRTKYTGSKADNIRSDFESTVHESIQRNYLDYYSNLYPHIELAEDIQILDEHIGSTNNLTVIEKYFIKDIWEYNNDSSQIYCQFHPLVLESTTYFPKSVNQVMPYYLGPTLNFKQTTIVHLPEPWNFKDEEITISNKNFKYENKITGKDQTLTCYHCFSLLNEYIQGDSIEAFLKSIDEAEEEYSYYVTYNLTPNTKGISRIAIVIFILSLCVALFLYFLLYKNYNPACVAETKVDSLGGWLILPLIGIILTPFTLSYQFFTFDFFGKASWDVIISSDLENKFALLSIIGSELIYNTFFIAYSVLLIILFFQKRTSLPRLISFFYAANLIFLVLDSIGVNTLFPNTYTNAEMQETYKNIGKAIIGAIIWIPYFNISKRVKNTFHKTIK